MRKPNFENLLMVLNKEKPHRPTIFEFLINKEPMEMMEPGSSSDWNKLPLGWAKLGYDFAVCWNYLPHLPRKEHDHAKTISLNDGVMIDSWETFEKYPWPDVDKNDYSQIFETKLPDNMKIIAHSPGGLLENLIALVGYDNLCMMLFDDPELVQAVVDKIATHLLKHYQHCLESKKIGACFVNDDWGFAQQPMLAPADMRKYIVPWTKRIVEEIHAAGLPALQHSCGNVFDCGLIDDVIDVCKFDGRHSYEDNTLPVEEAYRRYHKRLAIIGGIDVNYLCTRTPEEIFTRAKNLLELSAADGAYALGSGNSVPSYVPVQNYFAMIKAATGLDYPAK